MFQKYKYVLAVYREGSFTMAAKRLFLSQPSLSVAIRNIETEIGQPLFERNGAGIRPTEIGRAYIAAAEKMHQAEDEFEKKCSDIRDLQTGTLMVGGSNYLSTDVLPKIITRFRARYPNVEITLSEANSIRLRDMLLREEVDVAIDNFEGETGRYATFPLAEEQILLCVPDDRTVNSGLASFQIRPEQLFEKTASMRNVSPVRISEFRNESFILLKQGNDMHGRAMSIFAAEQVVPNVVFQVDQLNISHTLAESGMGACFLPDTLFRYRRHMDTVRLYKPAAENTRRMLYAAYKKGRYCTRAMQEFIALAQEMMAD